MPVKLHTVAELPAVSSEQVAGQVQKILHSGAFRSSEVLRHLLDYLTGCALEFRSEPIKVKEIAKAVFGRSDDFDSQSDSVVRVHTGRLRSKLAEYYVEEGADDELVVAIPKGSYNLSWHSRHAGAPAATSAEYAAPAIDRVSPLAAAPPNAPEAAMGRGRLLIWALALVLISSAVTWIAARRTPAAYKAAIAVRKPALSTFWGPFVTPNSPPLIVFSNFRLIGSLDTSVRPYSGDDNDAKTVIDTYTTIGEVMGVFDVTRLLGAFGQSVRAKHGQLLTWDDAKESNLIFVGGPLADTPLKAMPGMKDLQFRKGGPNASPESAAIVNLHPRPGEQGEYRGPEARPYRYDYAVIAVKPGFDHARKTLILAGITEYGTQGAAEFVTREERVNELLTKLNVKPGAEVPPFEALLKIQVQGGVPVQYELLLAHAIA